MTMFILMSHAMTPVQIEDAKNNYGVTTFVEVPNKYWGQIP